MARTDPVFNLRMPVEMKDELAERAKRNGRSLNAEIVQILEDAITAEASGFPAGDARELRSAIRMKDDSIENYKEILDKMTLIVQKVSSMALDEIRDKADDENKKPT